MKVYKNKVAQWGFPLKNGGQFGKILLKKIKKIETVPNKDCACGPPLDITLSSSLLSCTTTSLYLPPPFSPATMEGLRPISPPNSLSPLCFLSPSSSFCFSLYVPHSFSLFKCHRLPRFGTSSGWAMTRANWSDSEGVDTARPSSTAADVRLRTEAEGHEMAISSWR